jgi:hypothetical protein
MFALALAWVFKIRVGSSETLTSAYLSDGRDSTLGVLAGWTIPRCAALLEVAPLRCPALCIISHLIRPREIGYNPAAPQGVK